MQLNNLIKLFSYQEQAEGRARWSPATDPALCWARC